MAELLQSWRDRPDASLEILDPEAFLLVKKEKERQKDNLDLIASENVVSLAVQEMQGSVFTNKYAEGYPGRRYYGGCRVVDSLEDLAIKRAKRIFGCDFANVQPHSGSSANLAVFFSLLEIGDSFMALSLSEGGHLTHGASVNFSGRWFSPVPYGVDSVTGRIDMDNVRQIAKKSRPKMIIAGLTAYTRPLDFEAFRSIADEVGAFLLVDMAHIAGLVATGLHPSPFPHAHVVTSTTHKTLRGPRGGMVLWNDSALSKKINMAVFPGLQGGPLMHVIGAKAVAFQEVLQPAFKEYMAWVLLNAKSLATGLQSKGLDLVSGGTENHMVLVDLRRLDMSGREAEEALEEVGITCNKNTVPGDCRPPSEGSGIRLGTPAVTTRGMMPERALSLGEKIAVFLKTLQSSQREVAKGDLKHFVAELAQELS